MVRKLVVTLAMVAVAAPVAFAGAKKNEPEENPPTVAEAWNLETDIAKMNQQWASIEAVLEDDSYFNVKNEDVSAWSCGQQAGHLALALHSVSEMVTELLKHPNENTEGAISDLGKSVLEAGVIERGLGQAPEQIKPGDMPREELLQKLRDAKAQWAILLKDTDAIASAKSRAAHPIGQMTPSEFVRLMAVHNAHHLKIIRDILKAEGKEEFGKELMD